MIVGISSEKGGNLAALPGQRRSERVLIDVPVEIGGQLAGHDVFREETFTVTVSAHGALFVLAANVALGQKITVMNTASREELEGRVAYRGPIHAGLAQVAVEFARPAPQFWPVSSPPADWKTS